MDNLKDYMMEMCKTSYHEGIIDTIDNIQKALIRAKGATGAYPTMDMFVFKLLPEMRDMETKKYEEEKKK